MGVPCKCGSHAINDDTERKLCDVCLVKAQVVKLEQELEKVRADVIGLKQIIEQLEFQRDFRNTYSAPPVDKRPRLGIIGGR